MTVIDHKAEALRAARERFVNALDDIYAACEDVIDKARAERDAAQAELRAEYDAELARINASPATLGLPS